MLIRRSSRILKPKLGATLNYGHPLSANLVACWLLNEGAGTKTYSLINNNDALSFLGAATWVHGNDLGAASEIYMPTNGDGLSLTTPSAALKPTAAVSLFTRWHNNGSGNLTNNPSVAGMTYTNSNTSPFYAYSINRINGDATALFTLDSVGGSSHSMTTSGLMAAGVAGPYDALLTFGPVSGKIIQYFRGRSVNSSARSGSITYASPEFVIGTAVFNGQNTAINSDVIYVWNRELSASEAQWLHEEPYAMLDYAKPRVLYILPSLAQFTYAPTGGATLAGTALKAQGHAYLPTGGAAVAGTAPKKLGRAYLPTGGAVLAGSAVIGINPVYIPTGGAVLAGTAPKKLGRVYLPTGGATAAGTAPKAQGWAYLPTGGAAMAGDAPTSAGDHEYLPDGGTMAVGGSAPLARGFLYHVAGGAAMGGSAPSTDGHKYVGSGGAVMAGAASVVGTLTLVERYQDLAETTVAAGGYTAGSGVLNVASTASPFKVTGLYSVAISDPTSTVVKALLTVQSVASGTQFRVVSGGIDANCNFGDIVTAVLTERGIYQTRSDQSRVGTYPLLPTLASKGDRYRAADGYDFHYDGSSWTPYGFSIKMRKPVAADYSATGLASAVLTDSSNGLFLYDATAEEGLHLYKLVAPSTPYTITVRMSGLLELQSSKVPGFGLAFRESSSGKVETIMASNNAGAGANPGCWVGVDYWTDEVTYDSALQGSIRFSCALDDLWLQISDASGNKVFQFSADGINWIPIYSETRTTNLTANQVAWFIRTNNAAQTVAALLRSWSAS